MIHILAQTAIDSMVENEVVSLHGWINNMLWGDSHAVGYKELVSDFFIFSLVVLFAVFIYFIIRKIVVGFLNRIASKTKNKWDDQFLQSKILSWISLIIPVIVVWKVGAHAFTQAEYKGALGVCCEVLVILLVFLILNSLLNICERIYRRYEVSKKFPVKGFIQVIKIVMLICASIFVISSVIGKSPFTLFAGLGAMSAVLMFIFKDSILGLVAGVQLSANQMVSRGDWVEVPKFNADGEVLEVALTTVKIRNWDKTITTLPTYALISDSFKNWRGMSESGVRRIKRSINIDMQTVRLGIRKMV